MGQIEAERKELEHMVTKEEKLLNKEEKADKLQMVGI